MPLRLLTPSFSKMRFKYVLTEEISIARRFEISLSVNPSPISCATALSLDDNNDDDNESSLLDKLRLERCSSALVNAGSIKFKSSRV